MASPALVTYRSGRIAEGKGTGKSCESVLTANDALLLHRSF